MSNEAGGKDTRSSPAPAKAGAPRIFMPGPAPRSPLRLALSLVFLLIASFLFIRKFAWNNSESTIPDTVPVQHVAPHPEKSVEQPPPKVQSSRPGWIAASNMRGDGLKLEQLLGPSESTRGLRLCEYDGDDEISVAEACVLLKFAGLSAKPDAKSESIELAPGHSPDRIWQQLLSGAGIEDKNWGALRPWQHLRLKDERPVAELLAMPGIENDAPTLERLSWAIAGCDRIVNIGSDGFIQEKILKRSDEREAALAQELLIKASASANAGVRAAAAYGLGEILGLTPTAQLPATHPALHCLATLLTDSDKDVANAAALALGNSAAVPGLQLLVQRLGSVEKDASLAAVLAANRHAEFIGRRLDVDALGAENWELKRQLIEQTRTWITTRLPQLDPAQLDVLSAAAALRAIEMFAPVPEKSAFSDSLCNQLEQSRQPSALEVAAEFRSRSDKEVLQRTAVAKSLREVAGPAYHLYKFSVAHAWTLLSSKERSDIQAALWRLSRPENIKFDPEFDQDTLRQISENIAALAKSSPQVTLRRWALEALYCEHPFESGNHEKPTWHLAADANIALDVFMADEHPGVQLAAAGALGRTAGAAEIDKLAGAVSSRSAAAVEQLLRMLVQRNGGDAAAEPFGPPLNNLIELLLKSNDPALASLAAWAMMKDPGMDLAKRIRIARSFPAPAQRVSALKGISERNDRRFLQLEMLKALLADKAPEVRAAVFDCALPEAISSPEENTQLVLAGLNDADEDVQYSALKFRMRSRVELKPELKTKVAELAEKGSPKVRATAAALLHR